MVGRPRRIPGRDFLVFEAAGKRIYRSMTRAEFIQILRRKGYSYEIKADKLVVTGGDKDGSVRLDRLTSLPPDVVFKNGGSVGLDGLTTLPPDVVFENGGGVSLEALKSLPPDVVFKNGKNVWLNALTSLPPDVVFKNGENVWLEALKSLPPGVEFNNGGTVVLNALIGRWFSNWKGNIKGIDHKRLLNGMIKGGVFER